MDKKTPQKPLKILRWWKLPPIQYMAKIHYGILEICGLIIVIQNLIAHMLHAMQLEAGTTGIQF